MSILISYLAQATLSGAMLGLRDAPWRRLGVRRAAASMRAVLWHGDPDPAKMKALGHRDPPSGCSGSPGLQPGERSVKNCDGLNHHVF